jgi:hypothetical protein
MSIVDSLYAESGEPVLAICPLCTYATYLSTLKTTLPMEQYINPLSKDGLHSG